jgi:hypothetical protein
MIGDFRSAGTMALAGDPIATQPASDEDGKPKSDAVSADSIRRAVAAAAQPTSCRRP